MSSEFIHDLTSRSTLLAVGVSLCFVAIMLRGFVQSNRRALALRKQHSLHVRKPGDAESAAVPMTHWEKHLPRYTQGVLITGLVITLISFFRK